MKPTIINPASAFVVVTYWWGRGNKNKNTQVPCPEDLSSPDAPLDVQPITYEVMIENWEKSCKDNNCNYMAVEKPKFAKKGGYQKAINYKPQFIIEALKACKPRAVLYIDGDMPVRRYPHIFDMSNIDFAARSWNIDDRSSLDNKDVRNTTGASRSVRTCYDPYVFETSGGIMFFANTRQARQLAKDWRKVLKEQPGKADDRLLATIINGNSMVASLAMIELPIEYLWLTIDYDVEIPKRLWSRKEIIIEHPACLTGEDRAVSQSSLTYGKIGGISSSRIPEGYDELITNKVSCKKVKNMIYEYIFCTNEDFRKVLKHYFSYLKNYTSVDVIPYSKKYGAYNDIFKENSIIINSILPDLTKKKKYVTIALKCKRDTIVPNCDIIVSKKRLLVPTIISCLIGNMDVTLIGGSTKKRRGNNTKKIKSIIDTKLYDFIASNVNTKTTRYSTDYLLDLNKKQHMYFRHSNYTLIQLLMMCKNISNIDKVFNSSFDFLARIRCKWM